MKKIRLLICAIVEIFLFSCASASPKPVSLVNWNVQTFFDAETEGSEYSEFQSAGRWSKDKYMTRLNRLCEVMRTLNADIYVFEEIENEAVIYDLSNQLVGDTWNNKNKWHYSCFSKDSGASIGCAVISRFPLKDMKTHVFDIRTQSQSQPSVRPLLQVTVDVEGYDLVLFVNHWKSKLGDDDGEDGSETEIWRDWQEAVLSNALSDSGATACVICGDFNRDAREFVTRFDGGDRSLNTVFRGIGDSQKGEKVVRVYNPWFDSAGELTAETGSYYYENDWELIDNIFSYGNVKLSSFSARAEEPWANERGIPVGYKIFTGEGYSDHLPVMCTLVLGNEE